MMHKPHAFNLSLHVSKGDVMKLEKVSKIELVFENLEELIIPMNDVVFFEARNIRESMMIQNVSQKESRSIIRFRTAEKVALIFRNRPEYHRVFEDDDITQIHFYDEFGNHEWFYVVFDGDWSNENQKTRLEDDEIIITIAKMPA